MTHHEHPEEEANWSQREGVLAVGWGNTGNLSQQPFQTESDLKKLVAEAYPTLRNWATGGRSLWRFYTDMKPGDLVIISARGRRAATLRVTGDYYFVSDASPEHYEHRRRAEVVRIDPNQLWQVAGKGAAGEGIYSTLIRCARPITEAEFNALVG